MMFSDTKEYPLKLSGYSRVQIPCTLGYIGCGQPKAHPPPLSFIEHYCDTFGSHCEDEFFSIQSDSLKLPNYIGTGLFEVVNVICQVQAHAHKMCTVHAVRDQRVFTTTQL